MIRNTRPINWIKAARKDFEDFPQGARDAILDDLTTAAEGGFPGRVKPMKGMGSGVYEIALPHRGDAYRAVYLCTSGMRFGWSMRFRRNRKPGSRRRRRR